MALAAPRLRIAWLAEADGVAHAHWGRHPTWTACGHPAVIERFAWPAQSRCPECLTTLADLGEKPPGSHMSEVLLIAAYGGLPAERPIEG